MTDIATQLQPQLASLSAEDRAALAQFLIHSLDEGEDADAEAAWDIELTRRATEIQSGTATGKLATDVFKLLREKYS